jgi:signal transduction histidine kinase
MGLILAHRPDLLDAMGRAYRNETTVEITTPYTLLSTHELRTVHFTLAYVPPNYIACIMDDVTQQRTIETERAQLAERLLSVQETERREISALLHDNMGQLLTLARLDLESVRPADAAARRHLKESLKRIDESLASVRSIASSLHPSALDDLSASEALHTLVDDFARGSRITIAFRHPKRMPPVAAPVKVCLYRVMQEALTNAARHAHATRITVTLSAQKDMIVLSVRDNGRGFDAAAPGRREGIGIISMRERTRLLDGKLQIDSRPGHGCRVIARVPTRRPRAKPGDGL